jgi:hypothetical protein
MRLTTKLLASFAGGELEIQDNRGRSIRRGEIEYTAVKRVKIVVRFSRCAKMVDSSWVHDSNLNHEITIRHCDASTIDGGRILLHFKSTGVSNIFYPNGYVPPAFPGWPKVK